MTGTPWGWGGQVPSLRGSVYVVGWEARLPLRTSWGLGHSLPLSAWLPGWGLRLVSGPSEPRQVPGASSLPQNTYLPLPGVGSQVNSAEGAGSVWLPESDGGAGTAILGLWPTAEMG